MCDLELKVGEERGQALGEEVDHLGGDLTVTGQTRAKRVWCPAPTERDPIIGGALCIDERVRRVAEAFATLPADRRPRFVRQRLSRDHRREHRDDLTTLQPRQVTADRVRIPLETHEDRVRVDRAAVRGDRFFADMPRRGGFADGHALFPEDVAESASEQRTIDGRGAGEVQAAKRPVDVDAGTSRLGIEELHVFGPVSELLIAGLQVAQSRQAGLRLSDVDVAAAHLVGIDALGRADIQHLVDGVEEHGLEGTDTGHAVEPGRADRPGRVILPGTVDRLGELGAVARYQGRQPPAVAAGGAKADVAGLDDGDRPLGVSLPGVVGRPQAGQSAADDDEILLLARQWDGVDAFGGSSRQPVRGFTVEVGHGSTPEIDACESSTRTESVLSHVKSEVNGCRRTY